MELVSLAEIATNTLDDSDIDKEPVSVLVLDDANVLASAILMDDVSDADNTFSMATAEESAIAIDDVSLADLSVIMPTDEESVTATEAVSAADKVLCDCDVSDIAIEAVSALVDDESSDLDSVIVMLDVSDADLDTVPPASGNREPDHAAAALAADCVNVGDVAALLDARTANVCDLPAPGSYNSDHVLGLVGGVHVVVELFPDAPPTIHLPVAPAGTLGAIHAVVVAEYSIAETAVSHGVVLSTPENAVACALHATDVVRVAPDGVSFAPPSHTR